jgi:hypothetical protein
MKLNWGIWIGIVGGLAGFGIGIASVLTTMPAKQGYLVAGIMLAVFGGMALLFYKVLFAPMLNASRLQKTGIDGKAIITDVSDTGVTVNRNPQVKLTLQVKNSFGQSYTTTCRTLVSRINPFIFQPGMEVPVKIDPKNEKNVIIDMSGGNQSAAVNQTMSTGTAAAVNEIQLKEELEKMQQENDAIRVSGKPARAIITQYTWLGAYVNGNNPYVELSLEVLPDASPAFSAKARGVIAETSVEKYQPGKQIYVKYDYYDNSKVTIDHS